jgi:hypothetical protein
MKVGYFSPSYKRTQKSITQSNYPCVKLVVMEKEAAEYRANGNDIVVCPDKVQGNVPRVRNWILDNFMKDYDCIVIVDDDISYFGQWDKQQKKKMEPDQFEEFCEMHAIMCREAGLFLWGMNILSDKGCYREYTPFGFLQIVLGPFQAHMKGTQIRYDEKFPLKDDYDIAIQHLQRHRGIFRANYAFYEAKQSEQTGGCATYRNIDREKAEFFQLQRKWGSDVIKLDKSDKKDFDYNPVVHIPYKGV